MTKTHGPVGKGWRAPTQPPGCRSGCYVDDIGTPVRCNVAFVRSTHAHAAITSIDTAAAALMPGVVRSFCAADLEGICKPHAGCDARAQHAGRQSAVSPRTGEVVLAGCPVAAIAARTRAQAEDAAERVLIEYDELPAVVEVEQALAPDSPRRCSPEATWRSSTPSATANGAASFAAAATVVEQRIVFDRQTGVPLESRGIIASFAPCRANSPSTCRISRRSKCATCSQDLLSLPNHKVRVVCPDVGGASA